MNNRAAWIGLIVVFFMAGAAGSYFFTRYFGTPQPQMQTSPDAGPGEEADRMTLRIFVPKNSSLEPTERKLKNRTGAVAVAEAVTEEYFRTPPAGALLPQNVRLLGLYRDSRQMLYIDLSDEFRRNFQGDALTEFLVLKGLYDSLISNVQDFQDVRILVEGKEIESLGGHFFLKYPLKSIALFELKSQGKTPNE